MRSPLEAARAGDPRKNRVLGDGTKFRIPLCSTTTDHTCVKDGVVYTDLTMENIVDAEFPFGTAKCRITANDFEQPYGGVETEPISTTLVAITLPIQQCLSIKPGDFPLVAKIGDSTFGFPGNKLEISGDKVKFSAPRAVVDANSSVELSRFLLGRQYRNTYSLPKASNFQVDSVSISATSDKEIRYLVQGKNLGQKDIVFPDSSIISKVKVYTGGVAMEFSVSSKTAGSVKKVVFQATEGADKSVFVFDLPQVPSKPQAEKTDEPDGKQFKIFLSGTIPK